MRSNHRGVLLIEILLAIAIFGAIGAIAAQALLVSFRGNELAADRAAASHLLGEGLRAVRGASDESWQQLYGLTHNTTHYHPELVGGRWTIASGDETIELGTTRFVRYFTISHTSRDPVTRDIEATYVSANDDPSTQQVTVVVTASTTGPMSATAYVSRWRNKVCSQTTWTSGNSTGARTCPDTTYTNASNITPGEALELCAGGC